MANTMEEISPHNYSRHPLKPVKLLFIHHSVGGHWLAHENGGLVNELNKNNFYVNDVTYGWEPADLTNTLWGKVKLFFTKVKCKVTGTVSTGACGIGNRTDIGYMPEWFLGSDSGLIMAAIYKENLETSRFGDHSNSTSATPLANPNLMTENQVIMFKSCFPNTLLQGNVNDPAATITPANFSAGSETHTVANAKKVFNNLLVYFSKHPEKFFVIVTPPPQRHLPENGNIARGFSNWLVDDWRKENNYKTGNVMVFDLFNVLTSSHGNKKNDIGEKQGNHHRLWNGEVQHVICNNNNLLAYPSAQGDDHPSTAGLQKATEEFVPLLNYYYSLWDTTNFN